MYVYRQESQGAQQMNFTQWKNFGYPGQELTPFEPVLARDNLVTLTN